MRNTHSETRQQGRRPCVRLWRQRNASVSSMWHQLVLMSCTKTEVDVLKNVTNEERRQHESFSKNTKQATCWNKQHVVSKHVTHECLLYWCSAVGCLREGCWSLRDPPPPPRGTDSEASGLGSAGFGVWWGTAAPVGVSLQDSWMKAAEQWATMQDWPVGAEEGSWSLETIFCFFHCILFKLQIYLAALNTLNKPNK